MMTTLLHLFRVPTSFTPFDGERFIGDYSSSGPFFFFIHIPDENLR